MQACGDDALLHATKVLEERAKNWGAKSPELLDWIHAQDAVFAGCSGANVSLPADAPASASLLLRQDRAYQKAAALFYRESFDDAIQAFEEIGRDKLSPLHGLTRYVATRAVVCKAFLSAKPDDKQDMATFDPAMMKQAQSAIEALLKEPGGDLPRGALRKELDMVRLRTESMVQVRYLSAALEGPKNDASFSQHQADLTWYLNAKLDSRAVREDADVGAILGNDAEWRNAKLTEKLTSVPLCKLANIVINIRHLHRLRSSSCARLESMLLTISTTYCPATDLGYLLHKNPARQQTEELAFGKAHVFYPEANQNRCTVALMIEVDPVALVRGRRGPAGEGGQLEQYVNDRPYGANSFLSVALGRLFTTALNGKSKERQQLAETPIPLTASVPVIAARGGEELVRRLFEPLEYSVSVARLAMDEKFPEWGASPYVSMEIAATVTLQTLLTHLYVLIPVLDNEKHYWVGDDEVEKLLKRGEGWLAQHPEKELIVSRYLKRQRSLTHEAMERLVEDAPADEDAQVEARDAEEEKVERPLNLNDQCMGTVLSVLRGSGAKKVLDLGCGEGKLVRHLLGDAQFERIVGMDVSWRSIEIAADRLKLNQMSEKQRARLELMQGSLMYRDKRLEGFDAAAVVEVIEHLDAPRLAAFERVLFEFARPVHIVVTTPNVDYNSLFPTLPAGKMRHRDHRFEWTRAEFTKWAEGVAARFGYTVRTQPVGQIDEALGAPTQMGVFTIA